jgi:plastocyanin
MPHWADDRRRGGSMGSIRASGRRIGLLTLILSVALTLFAAGLASADVDELVKSKNVNGNWKWIKRHEYIKEGDTVRWKVPGTQNQWHDIHSYGGNWNFSVNRLDPGEGKNRTFQNAGAYKYRCVRHSAKPPGEPCAGMCGTIHVINV